MNAALDTMSERFLELATTGRPRPAIDYALELTAGGMSPAGLIIDVLAPIQQHVGTLWQTNTWTAAQEHAATSVVDGVLGALALRAPTSTRGSVLVACVEGEYHSVPARMGVERLRLDGWDVTFLGASLPAQDLQSFAARTEPGVVVLSCTVPLFLPGAARGIAAVADLGLHVVAAGAGFGATSARADRLGASGWIGPASNPTTVLGGPLRPARPVDLSAVTMQLELQNEDLVAACITEMFVRIPAMSSYNARQLAHTRADLGYILRYLAVSLDVEEPDLFDGFITWLTEVLSSRNVPPAVLDTSLDIVAVVIARAGFAGPAATCASARERLF
jgi:methanogenic corrinoid protein MtbC1